MLNCVIVVIVIKVYCMMCFLVGRVIKIKYVNEWIINVNVEIIGCNRIYRIMKIKIERKYVIYVDFCLLLLFCKFLLLLFVWISL